MKVRQRQPKDTSKSSIFVIARNISDEAIQRGHLIPLDRRVGNIPLFIASLDRVRPKRRPCITPNMPSTADIRKMHESIFVFDAHVDIEVTFLTPERPGVLGYDKLVTLEKMDKGGMDGAVFAIYIEQAKKADMDFAAAHQLALQKFEIIHKGVEETFNEHIKLALEPNDVQRIHSTGKKVALIGIENGYPIGTDLKNVQKFYDLGCRYITLSHAGHNQICSSSVNIETEPVADCGLTDFGRSVVAEMNRVGMIVDVAHVSKQTTLDAAAISKAPIIASHTLCRALNPAQIRIMGDEELLSVKKTGGVVHIVGLNFFLKEEPPEKTKAIAKLRREFKLPEREWEFVFAFMASPDSLQAEFKKRLEVLQREFPPVNVNDFLDHVDYAVNLLGIDHVGLSSDFFDTNYSLADWRDAGETFNVTLGLVRRGYTGDQIKKLWSENFMRVWREVKTRKGKC